MRLLMGLDPKRALMGLLPAQNQKLRGRHTGNRGQVSRRGSSSLPHCRRGTSNPQKWARGGRFCQPLCPDLEVTVNLRREVEGETTAVF